MEFDLKQLGQRALDHAQALVRHSAPRPAGSPAEAQARAWTAGLLRAWGYTLEEQPFAFPAQPAYLPYYAAAGALFALFAWWMPVTPWLCFILPLVAYGLPALPTRLQNLLPARAASANLLALPPGLALADARLLLVAHLDSARAVPHNRLYYNLIRQSPNGMLRLGLVLALLAVPPLLGVAYPELVYRVAALAASLAGLVWLALDVWGQLGQRGLYTPGANDNASGVGVLLAAAEYLAAQPAQRPVAFLFTGAEEAGLFGAGEFAARLRREGCSPLVLNLDTVGAGAHQRIVVQSGAPARHRTSPELNELLERALPDAQRYDMGRRDGDFSPFLRAGLRAGGLEGCGTPASWRAYHTLADDVDHLDADSLAQAAGAVLFIAGKLSR